ncbi:unannotated protein [freshwater metagenome]|uniref:Unannotated protein n=1 Tax=freshwater metagenome TaxID=449393 RepID=A0A6J7GWW2_9ZZZZ
MYAALWKVLPGPRWARALIIAGMGIAVLAVLVFLLFPWLDYILTRSVEVGP